MNVLLKAFGCLPMAADRDEPCSTSVRACTRTFASSLRSVWSARIESARRIGRPEFTIVANWRQKIATCLSLTRPGRRLISIFRPALALFTSTGVMPIWRSFSRTSVSLSPASWPVTGFPVRARTLYAWVCVIASQLAPTLVAEHDPGGGRGAVPGVEARSRPTDQAVQLFGVVAALVRELLRDLPGLDEGGE